MNLGFQIRQARKLAGLTQEELAAAANTTQASISHYECGQRQPGLEALIRIAGATSSPLSYFFEGVEGLLYVRHAPIADLCERLKQHPALIPTVIQYTDFLIEKNGAPR